MVKLSQDYSTSSICQDILKSDNLLHKWGFVDSQSVTNVTGVISRYYLFRIPATFILLFCLADEHFLAFLGNEFRKCHDALGFHL